MIFVMFLYPWFNASYVLEVEKEELMVIYLVIALNAMEPDI